MASPNPWDTAEKTGSEHSHQAALFMWANMALNFGYHVANYKEAYTVPGWALKNVRGDLIEPLKWLFAIHNQRDGNNVIAGSRAKAEGVKAGVADMMLPFPVCFNRQDHDGPVKVSYHGLFLELKVGKNQPDVKQVEFRDNMRHVGYRAEIAWGWLEARSIILEYLNLPQYAGAIDTLP